MPVATPTPKSESSAIISVVHFLSATVVCFAAALDSSQFTSEAFTSMLLAQGVQVSMDGRGRCMDNVFVERLWRSIKYEEVYLKAYQNGTEARKGIGAYLAFYNQERPHQALGYRSPGQVFQAVSPQRCLLEHPRALQSDEGLRDTPAVDSLILASPLS